MHCHCYAVCYEIKVYALKYSIHIVLLKKTALNVKFMIDCTFPSFSTLKHAQ